MKKVRLIISSYAILILASISVAGSEPANRLPNGGEFGAMLMAQFEKVRERRGKDYKPRTRHIRADGWAQYTNRLFLESSPYLIQHAHNPVNWYPWGDEAFETAKKLNRPVLLSVGYSTCHWCHVMEEESFEDKDIAGYMNKHYIAIKVDREERPDVDAIYMGAVQAMTGRGGWPMTVWLTPDRRPFYGGTYFPARDGDRGAAIGFLSILKKINAAYHAQPDQVKRAAIQLTQLLQQQLSPKTGDRMPGLEVMHQAIAHYKRSFDPIYGGISGTPKFPSSLPIRFLLRYYRRTGDTDILNIATSTLEKMAAGGIYDHVGGGFHRYATDQQWLVPHFEKMLYDNALLVIAYLEGYQTTGNGDFKRIAEDILRYVKRDMTSPEGAFYSATDADSLTPKGNREEGYFFTWTPDELHGVLGKTSADIVRAYYAVGSKGNFEGRHILHTPKAAVDIAEALHLSEEDLRATIDKSRELLYEKRRNRPQPLRDDKILTAWNALMISAHARTGFILRDPRYIERAVTAADFILAHLTINGRLYRSYMDGEARHRAYLDDYAFLIAALLDLYEATHDIRWLKKAMELEGILEQHFEDKEYGGFFMTGDDHEDMIAREKPNYDGAEPSGNSVALLNLLRLGEFTFEDRFRKRAVKALRAFLGNPETAPIALSEMLLALDFFLDRPKEIVIVTPEGKEDAAEPFLEVLRRRFLPNRVLIVTAEGNRLASLSQIVPGVRNKTAIDGKATAYVCAAGNCQLPTTDPAVFSEQLRQADTESLR